MSKMKKLLFLLLWLPCLAIASNAKDYYGYWKTTAVADYGHGDVIDNEEADKRVGEYLILSSWRVSFDGHHCKPAYHLSEVDPANDPDTGFRVSNETLKLPDPVLAIDTDCMFIYAIDKDHIVFESGGVIYRAVRHDMLKIKKKPDSPTINHE
jgi:hypothetical protein